MIHSKKPQSTNLLSLLTDRRRRKLESLGVGVIAIRPCKNCVKSGVQYRLEEDSEKCVDCIRQGIACDLVPLDLRKWRRLESERKRYRIEIRRARAKVDKARRAADTANKKFRKLKKLIKSKEDK